MGGGKRKRRAHLAGPEALRVGSDRRQRAGMVHGRQVFRAHSHYSTGRYARWGTFSKGEEDDLVATREYGFRLCAGGQLDLSSIRPAGCFGLHQ